MRGEKKGGKGDFYCFIGRCAILNVFPPGWPRDAGREGAAAAAPRADGCGWRRREGRERGRKRRRTVRGQIGAVRPSLEEVRSGGREKGEGVEGKVTPTRARFIIRAEYWPFNHGAHTTLRRSQPGREGEREGAKERGRGPPDPLPVLYDG